MPVRFDTARRQTRRKRRQHLPVVELAFVRQQPALREARPERRLRRRDLRAGQLDEAVVEERGGRVGAQAPLEERCFGAIAGMPDDQRPVALEKHRLGQFRDEPRPAFQRRRAEFRNQQLGAGRFRERREHRGRDPRRRLRASRVAAFVERDPMPRAGQLPRDEPPAQPPADDGEIRPMRRSARALVEENVHDAMPPQQRAAARGEVDGGRFRSRAFRSVRQTHNQRTEQRRDRRGVGNA